MADMGNKAPTTAEDDKTPPPSPTFSAPKRKRPGAENPVEPTQPDSQSSVEDHPLTQQQPSTTRESELEAIEKPLRQRLENAVREVSARMDEILYDEKIPRESRQLLLAHHVKSLAWLSQVTTVRFVMQYDGDERDRRKGKKSDA